MYMDAHAHEWVVTDQVECLRGSTDMETLRNVWAFVSHHAPRPNLRYKADQPGHERVKSPGALFASGFGDCKSFSIAEGAILKALGYPYRYRFTAYGPGDYTHVYVVATTPDGKDTILDAVHTSFDEEVQYQRKRDIRPQATNIQALPVPQAYTPPRFMLLRVAFATWLIYLLSK
jgi:hypothetical protein